MMKRKTLTTALLAGLAGAAGIANIADAVNQNPHNVGQVLIYPYYTTRGGTQGVNNYDTILTIVNTAAESKAVKVRFLESLNSREVLDFNLYMSPFDVWTAAVSDNGTGAQVNTSDNTCTVPSVKDLGPVAFRTLNLGTGHDGHGALDTSEDRTREGHVEMIEMGVLTGAAATATLHADSDGDGLKDTPVNCDMLQARWTPPPIGGIAGCGGVNTFAGNIGCWLADDAFELTDPTGGLFGGGSMINVPDGSDYGYNAVALGDCFDEEHHNEPGTELPSLAECNTNSAIVDYEFSGTTNPDYWTASWITGFQAVSSVLMVDTVMNEYATEIDLDGGTDWVITFPTKRLHIEASAAFPLGKPFTDYVDFNHTGTAGDFYCEEYTFFVFDREENTPLPGEGGVDFSPRPEGQTDRNPVFCYEANVLSFNSSNVLYSTTARVDADVGFESGWARIDFNSNFTPLPGFIPPVIFVGDGGLVPGTHDMSSLNGVNLEGFPTVGFAVRRTVNGQLNVGGVNLLSNYGALFEHATVQDVSCCFD